MSKRTCGPRALLFPLPTVIVGTQLGGQVNYMTVGYCGMIGGPPSVIAVGIGSQAVTYERIRSCSGFSVNIPSSRQIVETDYVGIVSGREVDKASVFTTFYGELEDVPMIEECPVSMECKLVEIHELGDMLACYGEIVQTHVDETCFVDEKIAISRVDPVLLSPTESHYLRVGDVIGTAYEIGKTLGQRTN